MITEEERFYFTVKELEYEYDEELMGEQVRKLDSAIELLLDKTENRDYCLNENEEEIIGDAYLTISLHKTL